MKKSLLLALVFFLTFTNTAFAATPTWDTCIATGTKDVATLSCIPIIMQNLVNFLALFAGVIAVFLIIWAGYKFITSQGDPEKVSSARSTLLYVLWGAIIIIISLALVNLIAVFTGVDSLKPQ